jgi:predicted PurR-regulated permease PerM
MVALAIMVLWAAYLVRDVLLLIYVSGLFAIGFSPIVRLIERQRLLPVGSQRFPRWLAILVLYVFLIGAVTSIGFMVFPPLIRQAQELWRVAPDMLARGFESAQEWLISKGLLSEHLTWRQAVERADVTPGGERAVGTVFTAITGVLGGLFGLFTILVLTFYLLVEADRLREVLLHMFPRRDRPRVDAAARDITLKVSAWLGGQLLLGLTIGVTSAIGLWLLDIPFFYVLALISGLGEMIPVVGPILSAIPAIAIAATVSWNKVLLVIVFFVVQQQFENHILVPKIMERQVGVSPVTVIVALLIGGNLMGIAGAILAVPSAAIIQVLINEWLAADEARPRVQTPAGRTKS